MTTKTTALDTDLAAMARTVKTSILGAGTAPLAQPSLRRCVDEAASHEADARASREDLLDNLSDLLAWAESTERCCAEFRDGLRKLLRAQQRQDVRVLACFIQTGERPNPWPFLGPERAAFAAGRRAAARLRVAAPVPGHLVDDVTASLATSSV